MKSEVETFTSKPKSLSPCFLTSVPFEMRPHSSRVSSSARSDNVVATTSISVSEDDHHQLQDRIFILQGHLKESQKRMDQYRMEASMNAQGLRKCIEEKKAMTVEYESLLSHCSKLECECILYETNFEKAMEYCNELGKKNVELRDRLDDESSGDMEKESSSHSTQDEIIEWQDARGEIDKKSEPTEIINEDPFWTKLRSAAEGTVGHATSDKFCKAFQTVYEQLVSEKLNLDAARKCIDAEGNLQ